MVNGEAGSYNPGGTPQADYPAELPHLEHRFTFWPATTLSMANMLGWLLVFATTPVRTIAMA